MRYFEMIDLILLIFAIGMFYGGFLCGNKYATLHELWDAVVAKFK